MRKPQIVLPAIAISISILASAGLAQTSAPGQPYGIDRYLNIRSASSPTFSQDGSKLAFLTNITGTPQVWMVSADSSWPEQLTFYADRVDFVSWSPDGSGLVFAKSQAGDENAQLFWLAPDGSQIRALTNDPQVRHNFGSWSHDGRKISYASNKRDKNFFDVYIMEVASGRKQSVYQQNGANQPVAWSFDDRYLVVSHDNEQMGLDNDLYLVEIATGKVAHLTPHEGAAQFSDVRGLPDGHSILLTTNNGREFQALAQMNLDTKRVDILDDTQWDVGSVEVTRDGSRLAYTINRDGFSELYVRTLDTDGKPLITTAGPKGQPVKLPGKGVVGGLEFTRDNRKLALTFNGERFNPDVWIYDLNTRSLSQVTHSSRAGIPQSSFVEPELIRYRTFDGRMIPAWYYRRVPVANEKLPVIVSVHGGPEGQALPTFSGVDQYFLSRGYAILAPNVRGSTGYGKTYEQLDDVFKREDSVKDLAAAVEWLKTQGDADPKPLR